MAVKEKTTKASFERERSGKIIAAINADSCCTSKNRRLASGLRAMRPSMDDQLTFLPFFFPLCFPSLIALYPIVEDRKGDGAAAYR